MFYVLTLGRRYPRCCDVGGGRGCGCCCDDEKGEESFESEGRAGLLSSRGAMEGDGSRESLEWRELLRQNDMDS